jgi:hypothetical protein
MNFFYNVISIVFNITEKMSHFSSIEAIADQAKTEAFMAEFEAVLAFEFADKRKSETNKDNAVRLANRARVLDWLADVALAKSEDAESKATASSVWLADTAVVM